MIIYWQNLLALAVICIFFAACGSSEQRTGTPSTFDLQGHRGARGLMPENTLAAFRKALELGVNTLELDLAVTADSQIVVSHEPWFSSLFCLDTAGNAILKESEKEFNIYQMTWEQVKQFDCGSAGNPRFPGQQKIKAGKPLLRQVFALAETWVAENNQPPVNFNIELKSMPEGDGLFHPGPAAFSQLVYDLLQQQQIPAERITIQSFDFRVLRHWRRQFPQYSLAALVEDGDKVTENIGELGFTPAIYSPYYKTTSSGAVEKAQEMGMRVIPWTVNEPEDMAQMLQMGVDGLITDYPDRALQYRQ